MKKIIKYILLIILSLLNIFMISNSVCINYAQKTEFCLGCGFDITGATAVKIKEDNGKILINCWQKEGFDIYYDIRSKYNYRFEHINPHTGNKCDNYSNVGNYSSLAISDYEKDTVFPVITNITKLNSLPSLRYTGSVLTPSVFLTYKGEAINPSTYCMYYSKATELGENSDDCEGGRPFGYTNNNFAPSDPGTYYVNILYNPDPKISPFLGRTSAKFEIKKDISVTPTVTLSGTSFLCDGKVKVPTVNSVQIKVQTTGGDSKTISLTSSDYTVSYSNSNSKDAGTYKVTVSVNGYKYNHVVTQVEGENIYDDDWYSGSTTLEYTIVDSSDVLVADTLKNIVNNSSLSDVYKKYLISIIDEGTTNGIVDEQVLKDCKETNKNNKSLCDVIDQLLNSKNSSSSPSPSPTPTSKVTPTSTPKKENTTSPEKEEGTTEAVLTKAQAQKVKVKNVKITRPKKKQLKIKWTKASGATKYQIQISTSKKFKSKYTKTYKVTKTSYLKKNLKSKKKYYIRVRSVASVNGKAVYGKWSAVKSIKTK